MRATLLLWIFAAAMLIAPSLAANPGSIHEQLTGTWSGGWMPEGGGRDAMTIEIQMSDSGKITGRFLTPVTASFSTATFNTKTHELTIEATDPATNKTYKLNAKVEGTEIRGSWTTGNSTAAVDLIKWTYVPTYRN